MFDIIQIQEILPHRYPLLLVDRITDMEVAKSIKGFKNISISEPAFQGHFPGHPIYPGVMILEDKAKFRNPVRPGDRLDYELTAIKMKSTLMVLEGKAYVDGKLTAEAEFKAMIVDK